MNQTRRKFLATSAAVAFGGIALPSCVRAPRAAVRSSPEQPWYRRTLRWGQTNITEADPAGYDKVTIPAGGHFEQEGHAVQMFAISRRLLGFRLETPRSGEGRYRRAPSLFPFWRMAISTQRNLRARKRSFWEDRMQISTSLLAKAFIPASGPRWPGEKCSLHSSTLLRLLSRSPWIPYDHRFRISADPRTNMGLTV